MLKTFILRHFVTAGVYSLLALAALIIYLAGLPPAGHAQGSLKDAPSFRTTGLRTGEPAGVPRPTPKPSGARQLWEAEDLAPASAGPLKPTERQLLLLRCYAYFLIATDIQEPLFADDREVAQYKLKARTLLREADKPETPLTARQQDLVFLEVFEEYVQGPKREVGLYDRYNEMCNIVVRPLLQSKRD